VEREGEIRNLNECVLGETLRASKTLATVTVTGTT